MLTFEDLNLNDRYELIKSLPKHWTSGVEIGVWHGWFTQRLIGETSMYIVGVDPFADTESYSDPQDKEYDLLARNDDGFIRHETRYIAAANNVRKICEPHNKGTILRTYSYLLKDYFRDESVDFVYIDGEHTYEAVAQDIEDWWPKVKVGGILAGHDYHPSCPGSIQAVDEFAAKLKIEFKTTGTAIEKGDADSPSWLFIKEGL